MTDPNQQLINDLRLWAAHTPGWPDDVIQNWRNVYVEDDGDRSMATFTTRKLSRRGSVDVSTVVGQWDHNAGCTWRSALLENSYRRSRMERVINNFGDNPQYYFNDDAKDIHFYSLNQKEWFSKEGNHRTIAAKFVLMKSRQESSDPPLLRGIYTHHFLVDFVAHNLFCALQELIRNKSLPITAHVVRDRIHAHNGCEGGDSYEIKAYIRDQRIRQREPIAVLDRDQLCKYAHWVLETDGEVSHLNRMRHWLRYLFGS